MKRTRLLLPFLAAAIALWAAEPTPLDSYVHAPDNHFRFDLKTRLERPGCNVFLLDMTSQAWRTAAEVNRPEWRHFIVIYKPRTVTSSIGLLFIGGGANDGKIPKPDARLADTARDTGSVVAELRMVPNQPLRFAGDPKDRVEDEMIAYTWDKYLKTGDSTWPARLPMTKSAVRAMDAITAFMASESGGGVKVDRYFVSGASKRGWTTWTTAATDKRVIGIAPIVIDLLNLKKSFVHHYRVYGFWAPAVKDYYELGLMDQLNNPKYDALMRIVEPYEYRDRYTMPKFLINSSGDQFFLPDSWQFYFNDLPGEKYLRYVPNTDHSLKNSDAWESLAAFYDSVLKGTHRPRFTWKVEKDGSTRVETRDEPSAVKLWRATNPEHRDFRLESVGPIYTSTDLAPVEKGTYVARVAKPAKGWTAYFVELTFPSGGKYPFKFTTGVKVVPDVLPFGEPVPGKTVVGPQKQIVMDHQSKRQAAREFKERKVPRGVYAIRCVATGQVWVGAFANLDSIKTRHWFMLGGGAHADRELQAAWNAHGEAAFEFEVLEKLDGDVPEMSVPDLLKEGKSRWAARLGATPLR